MISEKTLSVLEFNKVLDRIAGLTSFSAGKNLVRELLPSTDLDEARTWQRETAEAVKMIEEDQLYSLGGVRDLRDPVINAQRGVILEPDMLLDLRYTLRRAQIIKRNLGKLKGHYPLLYEVSLELDECEALQDAIETCIDDNGEIRDNASARLAIIRRDLKLSHERLQTKLNRIINSSRNRQLLQEPIITMRGGRYVIPLKAENKGKIQGIIHDSSSSGATIFIEPLDTVELNNQWREMQIEEQKEIRRILAELTDLVGDASERIVRTIEVLGYLDLTQAKAHYAVKTGSTQPKILAFRDREQHPKDGVRHPGSIIDLKSARHPLLDPETVVPIDIAYGDKTWMLVVTGPNTGGKTVALKTVGLMALMAQSGIHVPAEEASLTVFSGIFADIGDEQSIEQSLSTFSSHMTNIIGILRECTDRSLVILDELGAGTDPAEGAALARALLNRLRERSVTTMTSTHHPELKTYAVEVPGVRNASMEFDIDTLSPTYRLIVGLPGRSNALAIASRLGLDKTIIEDARSFVSSDELATEGLLDEIQETRQEIRRKSAEIEQLRAELAEEREKLQERLIGIEDERRDILMKARREGESELEGFKEELKRLRKELRQVGMPVEKLNALKDAANKIGDRLQQPLDDDEVETDTPMDWTPRLGDTVFVDTLNSEGTIVELDEKEATVQVGKLRVRAKYNDIRKRNRSEKRQEEARERTRERKATNNTRAPQVASPGMEIDLRGQRIEEAIEKLDRYIDAAYLSGLPFGRIIHGKGTGRLRTAVRDYVNHHALISKVTGAAENEGGSGVTVIHLVPAN